MPKPRPLSVTEAKRSIAHRFTSKADNLRQLATKFGVRPYRVFLVWTKWSGTERGEGDETVVRTTEILPTPKVDSLDNVSFSLAGAVGAVPVGSLKVSRISGSEFTSDMLRGIGVVTKGDHVPEPYDFYYEVMEDGRGDEKPQRQRFRLLSQPFRRAGKLDWVIALERVSEDRSRGGKSQAGKDIED